MQVAAPPVLRPAAGAPQAVQAAALGMAQRGWRKVVVATNVAETSLTCEGVV
jgi:HrpA-like RNA helicase